MSYSVLSHPYPEHTRVHHFSETNPRAYVHGVGHIVGVLRSNDGSYLYQVRYDQAGQVVQWPAAETIPAGTWRAPDPLA
ncbi:hypothetical protein ACQEU5_18830 [Marinactinospora thermotolerans]|uniref:Uncharacterized protein n=1 Tax=Marinactinospora thermotolerans DSM 45154 TaxID=1122192 RepID=A0A1T4NBW4_9ACTN|nr:hypothetical protein [Marinactinospora thermotolerans]SJZ76780.1 hypothetical protein SAMN02745673_01380 [Marinactinospora thermotolerans DSM 45154]